MRIVILFLILISIISNTYAVNENIQIFPIKLNGGTSVVGYKVRPYWETDSVVFPVITNLNSSAYVNWNNNIYLIGGSHTPNAIPTNMWKYNGTSWTILPGPPIPTRSSSCVVFRGKLFVLGGLSSPANNTTQISSVYSYNGTNWVTEMSMPNTRAWFSCVVYNDKIYALGGWGGSPGTFNRNTVWSYNGTNWTVEAATLPAAVAAGHAFVMNNKIFLCGNMSYTPTVYSYDGTNWATEATSLPNNLAYGSVSTLNGYAYICGGYTGTVVTNALLRFDGTNWTKLPPVPITNGSYNGMLAPFNNKLYYVGGYPNGVNPVYIYTP